jgi:hypothetical protein
MATTTYKGAYLPTVSGDSGTWGTLLNTTTFPVFDANLGGLVSKTLSSSNVTLSASEAQNAIVRLTGTLSANVVVTSPCQGFHFVENLCTLGAYTVTLKETVSAAGVEIPYGRHVVALDQTNGARIVGTTVIADGAVTYAKIQDVSATSRILGRRTAGSGTTEECTLTQILDFIGSAAQGDVLYRGSSGWQRLATGTSGQFLKSGGAGADLSWGSPASGVTLLTSGTVSGAATLSIPLTSYTSYRGIKFVLSNWVPVTDDTRLTMRFSTNGGSSYDSGASDYAFAVQGHDSGAQERNIYNSASSSIVLIGDDTGSVGVSNTAAAGGCSVIIDLLDQTNTAVYTNAQWIGNYISPLARTAVQHGSGVRYATQDTDGVEFRFSSGNITSGKYAVYGYE